MPNITVKNIPDELYERLKESAQAHRRSINSEILVCIEQAVYSQRLAPEAFLERARLLRQKTAAHSVSDEEFTQTKEAGRP